MGCKQSRPSSSEQLNPTPHSKSEVKLDLLSDSDWVIRLKILEAKDLPAADSNGLSDPFCVITFGERTFKTKTIKKTLNPVWNQRLGLVATTKEREFGVEFIVNDQDKLSKNDFLGKQNLESVKKYADGEVHDVWLDLHSVRNGEKVNSGKLRIEIQVLNQVYVETKFWEAFVFSFSSEGKLNKDQLGLLLEGISMYVSDDELNETFQKIDANKDGFVTADEVYKMFPGKAVELAKNKMGGKETTLSDEAEALYEITVCSEKKKRAGNDTFVIGGFLTEAYATRGFSGRLLNRIIMGKYNYNEDSGNIIVKIRKTGAVQEEKIPGFVRIGIRAVYQNNLNIDSYQALLKTLRDMTAKQGKEYEHPDSVKHIIPFIDFHQLDMEESLEPVSSFKNFNEFFYRKLKPSARPIEDPENSKRLVSAADCRFVTFKSVDLSTEFWIKGKNFSISGLFKDEELAKKYEGGSMCIFRLAPQDYHRFHHPVGGKIVSMKEIPGEYFTVNPMAVRADVDVFTENKRHLTIIESPEFGSVAFVAIGATMVGSIIFTDKVGDVVKKGDEHGYFAFGGSTVIIVFEAGKVNFDEDLLITNENHVIETVIRMGEGIGNAL